MRSIIKNVEAVLVGGKWYHIALDSLEFSTDEEGNITDFGFLTITDDMVGDSREEVLVQVPIHAVQMFRAY